MKPQKRGRYRQRVELYDRPEATTDTWGQPSPTPVLIGTFWAEIVPLAGNEMLNVRQMWPTATHTVYILWLGSSISPTDNNPQGEIIPSMTIKARLDNSYLNVINANNTEYRNRQWKITCEEKVGAIS